tara:strand:- start:140 stop:412 length:273 start_codon:yes stop_codon:yes gene_type:complete
VALTLARDVRASALPLCDDTDLLAHHHVVRAHPTAPIQRVHDARHVLHLRRKATAGAVARARRLAVRRLAVGQHDGTALTPEAGIAEAVT